jgi:hypothetical protein
MEGLNSYFDEHYRMSDCIYCKSFFYFAVILGFWRLINIFIFILGLLNKHILRRKYDLFKRYGDTNV